MMLRPGTIPREVAASILLVVLTVAVFWQMPGFDFIRLDDDLYVMQNHHVQSGFTRESFVWAFTNLDAGFWHPLTWLSLMLDFQLYGLNPAGFHWTNLLFHVANTILLFLVLNRMTGALWRSAFVAALFSVHPLHVESVAWIAERKDVLSTFFWMLSMGAYLFYVHRPRLSGYMLVLLVFLLGVMSKTMVVTLPLVFLLLDYWPLVRFQLGQRDQGGQPPVDGWPGMSIKSGDVPVRLILEKIPFIILAIGSIIVTYLAERGIGAINAAGDIPFYVRAANILISYATYMGKMVWPSPLAVYYPHPGYWPLWQVIGSGVVLLGVSLAALRLARRFPYMAVGWLWYLVTLAPVVGFIQIGDHCMADRYTYVPLIGLFIMITWGLSDLFARWHLQREVVAIASAVVLCILSVVTWAQLWHWQNSVTLFKHTLAVTKDNYLIYNNMGAALAEKGETEEALSYYRDALRIRPDDADARYNMGNLFLRQDKPMDAVVQYAVALGIKPGSAPTHNNMGLALLRLGKTDDAITHFNEAVRIDPQYDQARHNLNKIMAVRDKSREAAVLIPEPSKADQNTAEGQVHQGLSLVAKGKIDEAIPHFREALRIKPDSTDAHVNLGLALAHKQNLDEAIVHFRKAVKLKPGVAETHNSLGVALAKQGKLDEAIPHFQEALRINPRFAKAHNSLGVILARKGQMDDAVIHLREAVRIKPDYEEARQNLRVILNMQGKRETD